MTTRILNEPIRRADNTLRGLLQFRADTITSCHASTFPESRSITVRTYDDEKEAFQSLRMMLESRHPGEYVAIKQGAVVDHDRSRLKLVQRFFGEGGEGPVYVGFVGPQQVIRVPTPVIRRR